jgi:putative transposase
MPRRARQVAGSGIYHVMLRGVNRDVIFLEDEDRERFLFALKAAKDASECKALAYCLMDNHVHLVLRSGIEPIGSTVRRFGVRYAGWFNRKYDRVGHLFQDRFKSVPVDEDAHFITLMRYVWNNPVEAGLVEQPEEYRWSSRRFFGGSSSLIDTDELDRLLPDDVLAGRTGVVLTPWEDPRRRGPRARYSDAQAAGFLEQACGAHTPESFSSLDVETQQRVIHALRTRSVPFAQLAKLTGLSNSALKRMHVAGMAVS